MLRSPRRQTSTPASASFDGKTTLNFGGYDDAAAVALQPDGAIVVAGHTSGNDHLSGGAGRDHLIGGPQRDRCIGGGARDRATTCETRRSL